MRSQDLLVRKMTINDVHYGVDDLLRGDGDGGAQYKRSNKWGGGRG